MVHQLLSVENLRGFKYLRDVLHLGNLNSVDFGGSFSDALRVLLFILYFCIVLHGILAMEPVHLLIPAVDIVGDAT